MKRKIPRVVNVIELENAPFKCAKDADAWARSHGIVGLMSNVDTAGKGEVAISVHSLNKMLSGSALEKSSTPALHFAALMRLRDSNFPSKAYSYEISNIEILRETAAPVARPSNKISMDVGILLNGVCDVNGVPLLAWRLILERGSPCDTRILAKCRVSTTPALWYNDLFSARATTQRHFAKVAFRVTTTPIRTKIDITGRNVAAA